MFCHHKMTFSLGRWNLVMVLSFVIASVFLVGRINSRSIDSSPSDTQTQDLLMRGARPKQADAYMCTAYPVKDEKEYIYKFEALANASTAHHMLLYGCDGEPYSQDDIWDCQAMCSGKAPTILFAWAKNAPPTVLPKGVGLRIGQQTTIKTLVLQVHYARAFTAEESPDKSGIRIYTTHEEQPFVAGIFLLAGSFFSIPPNNPSYPVDISCKFYKEKSIFPFAYRTHAHSLGKVITGYQYNTTYHLIGKGNPQWPQAFYPVKDDVEIKPGDSLAARCTYDSTSMTHPVSVGSTGKNEMCNFYIMFYTDSSVKDPYGQCSNDNQPRLTGDHFPADVSEPLPSNPDLEEEAKGNHQHSAMGEDPEPNGLDNEPADSETQDFLMKGAKPEEHDAYLCSAYPITDEELYIYKFEALANASVAHHMLLYGCDGEAYHSVAVANCPPMCKGAQSILFAWAKNAPPTVLPKDVGVRIGQKSSIKTIVLQVHYAKAFTAYEQPDHSGIRVYITHQKQPYVAGIFLLGGSRFTVPPGQPAYPVEASCKFNLEKSIFPFAYRTHAHGLGTVITGYQYNGSYHEIGKGNPQWPQAFYPVQSKIEVKPGDYLAARCTYDSTGMDHAVGVGATGDDEMCNFYIMFYTDSSVQKPSGDCWGDMNPELTGNNFPDDVSVPLPPNPALEEEAKGHHHQHGGMAGGGSDDGSQTGAPADSRTMDILMRGAKPNKPDAYLCTAYPISDEEAYIYKFEAMADAEIAHHILMFGCDGEPFSDQPIWNCPRMCKDGGDTIMFAWAKNAPPTVLPSGVGVRIGQQSTIKTVVLQVHYADPFKPFDTPDNSGIRMHITNEKQPFVAGIFLLWGGTFIIPPGKPSYGVDVSCTFNQQKSIFPFAYRTHAHGLGTVITGYQHNGTYHEIGKGNPQWPQAFYPVKDKIEVKPGDALAARCTYDSTDMDHSVGAGHTGNDEMCNFYIMFYTDSSVKDPSGNCMDNQLPSLTGSHFPADVSVPLPPNPALEEEAKGHHHHGGMNGGGDSGGSGKVKENNHIYTEEYMEENVADYGNKVNLKTSVPGHSKEILQYDYDFDELGSEGRYYEKRRQSEYYDDYAANDLREKGLYGPQHGGQPGPAEEELSRNRNKEFEAMNQHLQQIPNKGQPQHQQRLPQSQAHRQPQHQQQQQQQQQQQLYQQAPRQGGGDRGGSAQSNRPGPAGPRPPVSDGGPDDGAAAVSEAVKIHSHIHFENKLVFNASWPSPDVQLGQIGGLATDKDGNVYIFHRASRTWTAQSFSINNDFNYQNAPIPEDTVVILDSQGRLIRKFGGGQYFMPHGIEVDKEGNIWLTDVGLHQVFKIPPGDTKPSLTLGHKFQHSEDPSYFCKPTDVAVLSSGEFYVADGYCNSRILKFAKDGSLIKMWGQRDLVYSDPPPVGAFNIPHSVTVSEENQLVCVADRENGRIQCFDLDGNFKHIIKHPEFGPRVFAIEQCPEHGGLLYAVNGPAYDAPPEFYVSGFTLDIKTGDLLERWDAPQHLKNPHDVCVHPATHSVYVGELDPRAVWKFQRVAATASSTQTEHEHEHPAPEGAFRIDNNNNKLEGSAVTVSTQDDGKTSVSNDTELAVNSEPVSDKSDFTPSIIIGCLLVVPVVLLLVITLLVRAHQSGKLKCWGSSSKRVFSLQGILGNSHKGFDPLSTEESDHDIDPEDSDHEEYLAPKKTKNKA